METYKPGGKVYEAMMLARGSSVKKAKKTQPSVIDLEDLIWPLSVPWSGSFLTSANTARDFPRHGVFAGIEEHVVNRYREGMVHRIPEINNLRYQISLLLGDFLIKEDEGNHPVYTFPDKIPTLDEDDEGMEGVTELGPLLLQEQVSNSFTTYNREVEDIVKCCAKQSVMLAHPSGSKDSAVVREAFDAFIKVSVGLFQMAGLS
jgi:hypothetical protein